MRDALKSYFCERNWQWFFCLIGIAGFSGDSKAALDNESGIAFFENHIRPVLVESSSLADILNQDPVTL